jgi:hypothetical protein
MPREDERKRRARQRLNVREPDYYLEKANHARRMAEDATDPLMHEAWLELAATWSRIWMTLRERER